MKLTPEQEKAINSRKENIVVSASAGSGKTGTMVLRVIDLIKEGVSPDRIVMLTYTENAAHEMMERLSDALFDEIRAAKPEDRAILIDAHDHLPMLSCGTIHAFCYKLIMAHFEQLGLSPLYTIVEQNAAKALKERVFNGVLRSRHAAGGQTFIDFLAQFDAMGDEGLRESVKQVYDCMTSLEERDGCLDEWERIADTDLEDIPAIGYYLAAWQDRMDTILAKYHECYEDAIAAGAKEISEQIAYRVDCLTTQYSFASLRDFYLSLTPHEFGKTPTVHKEERETFGETVFKKYSSIESARTKFEGAVKEVVTQLSDKEKADEIYSHSAGFIKELLAFVREFDQAYEKVKEERKLLDFSDLEKYALQLLKKEEIRREIACDHVLVDEKQDVNPIQDRLVRLLSEGHSLFSVGDVKQSIFRFRQGAPEIFLQAMREGRDDPIGSDVILFDRNFRSSKAVISFVNEVFAPLMTEKFGGVEYSETPLCGRGDRTPEGEVIPDLGYVNCTLSDPKPRTVRPPVDSVFDVREADRLVKDSDTDDAEVEWVLKCIREVVGTQQYNAKKKEYFTVGYGDIAILSAKRGDVSAKVIDALRDAQIPMDLGNFKKEGKEIEVEELTDLMRLILSPHDDYAFVSALRSPMFEFDLEEIARISLIEGKDFCEKAKAYAESEEGGKMRAFFSYVDKIRFDSSVLPVADLLARIIEERFRLPLLSEPDGKLRFGALRSFVSDVRAKHLTSVAEYIDYFDNEYKGTNSEIPDGNAVTFMTIHGSKGLEFPVVIVIDTGKNILSQEMYKDPIVVDKEFGVHKRIVEKDGVQWNNLSFKAVLEKKKREGMEDALRLMYVALTRAKNVLYVSGRRSSTKAEKVFSPESAQTMADWILFSLNELPHGKPTVLPDFAEAKATETPSAEESSLAAAEEEKVDPATLLRNAFAYEYKHKIATTTGIKYTVTGINNMEDDGYYPPKPLFAEDKTERGTAMHAVMENLPFTVTDAVQVEEYLDAFVKSGIITEEERKDVDPHVVLDAARRIRTLIGDREEKREKTFMLRLPAFDIGIDGLDDEVVVQGKVDLLAVGEKDAVIVDYKVSGASDAYLTEHYHGQLSLYALAVKRALGIENISAYIFVLGRNRLIEIRL